MKSLKIKHSGQIQTNRWNRYSTEKKTDKSKDLNTKKETLFTIALLLHKYSLACCVAQSSHMNVHVHHQRRHRSTFNRLLVWVFCALASLRISGRGNQTESQLVTGWMGAELKSLVVLSNI